MISVYLLLIAVAIFPSCLCKSSLTSDCPNVQVLENFDVKQYLGLWYEQRRYPLKHETGAKCVNSQFSFRNDGTIEVIHTMITARGRTEILRGSAEVTSTTGEAKMALTFNVTSATETSPLWVLGTDYTSYAVGWSCPIEEADKGIVWIFSRELEPSEEVLKIAKDVLVKNNLSLDPLIETNQKDCS